MDERNIEEEGPPSIRSPRQPSLTSPKFPSPPPSVNKTPEPTQSFSRQTSVKEIRSYIPAPSVLQSRTSPTKGSVQIPFVQEVSSPLRMPSVLSSRTSPTKSTQQTLTKEGNSPIRISSNLESRSSPTKSTLQSPLVQEVSSPIRIPSVLGSRTSPTKSTQQTSVKEGNSPIRISSTLASRSSPTKGSAHISLKSETFQKMSSPVMETEANITTTNQYLTEKEGETKQDNIIDSLSQIEPKGKEISDQVDELTETIRELSKNLEQPPTPVIHSNIGKIANMSKKLTNEAEALRASIRSLSQDIMLTKQELGGCIKQENVNFPYHLFLIEIIINSINLKCDCFEIDFHNLVIEATFLGKEPITLYDSTYGKLDDLRHLNVGKSALFAMTYDKICSIQDFIINIQLTRQPPCSNCVMKVAETIVDVSKDFVMIREELCKKWLKEQPKDNIACTASSPLKKNMCSLIQDANCDPIGLVEITTRMSFLGKEITTAFNSSSKQKCTSTLMKDDHGVSMYSCQNVEMDAQGNVVLNEDVLTKQVSSRYTNIQRLGSPTSVFSDRAMIVPKNKNYVNKYEREDMPKYDEIFTKMNANELKIRVPKTTKFERTGRYDKVQELCSCEETPYNTGEQIQFELPKDLCNPDKTHNNYSSNLKYTYNGCDRTCESKDRKVINVTPTTCPVPVNMEKEIHPNKDVFILKIGKKLQTKDKKTDLEIELVTPKSPFERPAENHISTQSSTSADKESKPKSTKKKSKKGQKGKSKTSLTKKKSKSKGATKKRK